MSFHYERIERDFTSKEDLKHKEFYSIPNPVEKRDYKDIIKLVCCSSEQLVTYSILHNQGIIL